MNAKIGAAVVLAVTCWSAAAAAECTPVAVGGVVEYQCKITSRPARPAVGIDVARLVPRAPLPELRQPLVERIARAVEKSPF